LASTNEWEHVNGRSNLRSSTGGEAGAVLFALDGRFSPVAVDVMNDSSGGVRIFVPQNVPFDVVDEVALRVPVQTLAKSCIACRSVG